MATMRSAPRVLALDPKNPYHSARQFLDDCYTLDGVLTLRHHNGLFYRYHPALGYYEAEINALRADLYAYMSRAPKAGGRAGEYCKPTSASTSDLLDACRAIGHWPVERPAPVWMSGTHPESPIDLLPCANGILHLPTRRLLPPSPELFSLNGTGFVFTPHAKPPALWLAFLHQILCDDLDAQALLQEWFGYMLTTRTAFQKILLIVGPKRSGKGTIGRVLRELVGKHHLVSPTLGQLGEQFGRQALIDKSVALIADARLSGRTDLGVLAEVLLSISGEDTQTIPRKHLGDWTGTLPTRFTIMTNEIPRIPDASGALASRFLMLVLRESFYGREDQALFTKLQRELSGILLWALDGLERLLARGHFVTPASAADAVRELEWLSSPILAFVDARCEVRVGLSVGKASCYAAYQEWAKTQGQSHVETFPTFCRNLRAALPFISDAHPRGDQGREPRFLGFALRGEATLTDSYVV